LEDAQSPKVALCNATACSETAQIVWNSRG